jgi:hypothetical protein
MTLLKTDRRGEPRSIPRLYARVGKAEQVFAFFDEQKPSVSGPRRRPGG